jgi:glycosyltransferase involved in cell wall biosynthesis
MMPGTQMLVSIGLPIRNGEKLVESVVRSVLGQVHEHIELVISDNASTDGTEEICRELARSDRRIAYYRQPENIGPINNNIRTKQLAQGMFFRLIGDDDLLLPNYVSRCLEAFAEDERLILVTTQLAYTGPDGNSETLSYHGTCLRSEDPVTRFSELLRLLNESHLLLDPLYGLFRKAAVASVPIRNTLRGDEVLAAKLALAGPWGHVPEVLGHRHWKAERLPRLARNFGLPPWQAHVANVLQCRELLAYLRQAELTPSQHRRARAAVGRLYLHRHWATAVHRSRRLGSLTTRGNTGRLANHVPPYDGPSRG